MMKASFQGRLILTKRLKFIPRKPLPSSLVIKEEYEIMGFSVGLSQAEHLLRRDGDGHSVVEISRPWHLGVDDQGGVPGIPATLGPHKVQGLQLNVGCGNACIALVS